MGFAFSRASVLVWAMSLADFLGRELVSSLAGLDSSQLFGAWPSGSPGEARKRKRFSPVLYREDHVHPHQEYCHLMSGRCNFSFQHRTVELKPGDMVACPGGVHHAETFCSSRSGYRLAWWILLDKEPMFHVRRYRGRGGYDVEYIIWLTSLTGYGEERLRVLRELAARSIRQKPEVATLREAMLSVTLELYRQILKGGETPFDARAELVRKMTDFVRNHAARPLTLADVAKAVHMSPNYLTSLFRSQTGTSLGRFILTERIALAQRMLRQPLSSVKSVGLDVGFSDPFTFSRAFKRITGLAPRSWLQSQGIGREGGS
jgi:AraC-like DNA-binding protein